ncbi:tyrosine-type recombinase/integrase [Desulfolutivibrio sp.]|uniref:tyrosine-type recombinase/integrase n=1 Tax=Desulfolutivibrio sp. TaxID=2773296 RepID=UPI002F961EC6
MSVERYETKEGRKYRAVFEFLGQRYKRRGFRTQKDANSWIAEERKSLEAEEKRAKVLHLSTFVKQYLEAEAERLDQRTIHYKSAHIQALYDFLGVDRPVEGITRETALAFQKHFLKTHPPVTLNRYVRDLKTLWNWHTTNTGLVSSNPFKIPRLPEAQYIPYIPPKEDIDKVLSVATGWGKDFLLLMLATAARRNEIRKLTWADVDFEQKLIRLKTKKRQGGGEEWDNLPMNATAESVLKRRYAERKHPEAVFPAKIKLRSKSIFVGEQSTRSMLVHFCQEAGVKPFSFHPLRHYVASILRDKHNASLFEIQHVLRHKKPGTTALYLDTLKSPVEKPLNSLADEFAAFV